MTVEQAVHVCFLRVTDNISKQERLCRVVHNHFAKNYRVLILAPTIEAAKFLDALLWKIPKESFTPHVIANTTTKERIVITTAAANINQATVLVNLSGSIPGFLSGVEIVYELLDLTAPDKEAASRLRQAAYSQAGIPFVESDTL
ncbi:MAG: DNA polymerase III subunit chi [Parachlamydiaceae bacterium]